MVVNFDVNTAMLLGIAAINLATAFMAYNTRNISKQVEINTNSMKDALVAATKTTSHREGLDEGIAQGVEKAATLAQGQLEGKSTKEVTTKK